MSHVFRFHGQRSPVGSWQLFPDEWYHLLKVLRVSVGTRFEICDGFGWSAQAKLVGLGKHEGNFELEAEIFSPALPSERQITLGLAALKPQSVDDIIPPLVELGLDRLLVFPYAGMAKGRLGEKIFERWQRIVAAAAKQCKRPWWPELVWLESFEEFLSTSQSFPHRLLLDPEAPTLLADFQAQTAGPVIAAIGSEKGFSEEESRQLLSVQFRPTRIEGAILRAITAALATTAILRQNPQYRAGQAL